MYSGRTNLDDQLSVGRTSGFGDTGDCGRDLFRHPSLVHPECHPHRTEGEHRGHRGRGQRHDAPRINGSNPPGGVGEHAILHVGREVARLGKKLLGRDEQVPRARDSELRPGALRPGGFDGPLFVTRTPPTTRQPRRSRSRQQPVPSCPRAVRRRSQPRGPPVPRPPTPVHGELAGARSPRRAAVRPRRVARDQPRSTTRRSSGSTQAASALTSSRRRLAPRPRTHDSTRSIRRATTQNHRASLSSACGHACAITLSGCRSQRASSVSGIGATSRSMRASPVASSSARMSAGANTDRARADVRTRSPSSCSATATSVRPYGSRVTASQGSATLTAEVTSPLRPACSSAAFARIAQLGCCVPRAPDRVRSVERSGRLGASELQHDGAPPADSGHPSTPPHEVPHARRSPPQARLRP